MFCLLLDVFTVIHHRTSVIVWKLNFISHESKQLSVNYEGNGKWLNKGMNSDIGHLQSIK